MPKYGKMIPVEDVEEQLEGDSQGSVLLTSWASALRVEPPSYKL